MNPKLAHLLVCLYPRPWRERYGAEFQALLQTGGGGLRTSANVVWSALCERIFPTPELKIELRRFQSWCLRAPWAMFGLAPLFLLAAAYFVAGLILRSGWKVFLPGTNTPFAPIDGFAVFYFGAGRLLYYGTPILIGWGIGFTTARQRLMTIWPTVGSVLIALIGGFSRVRASRPAAPWPSRTYQHGLSPWAFRSGYFPRPISCLGDSLAHHAAVCHLADYRGPTPSPPSRLFARWRMGPTGSESKLLVAFFAISRPSRATRSTVLVLAMLVGAALANFAAVLSLS